MDQNQPPTPGNPGAPGNPGTPGNLGNIPTPGPGYATPPPPPAYGYPPGGGWSPPQPPYTPQYQPPPQPPRIPIRPQVVHVVSKPGGWVRALTFILSLFVFAIIFFIGIGLGAASGSIHYKASDYIGTEIYHDGGSKKIAILPVEGIINSAQAAFVHAAVDRILDDKNILAVVLRVDSPGGGVTSSDQIWYEIKRLSDAGKPVIASYGGIAASGGYYVSCAADEIIAEPTCITGSIGVIAQILTMEGLLEKVGIEPVTLVATGSPQKDVANDVFRSWNEQDREKVMIMLDASYETFTDRVRDGRSNVITSDDEIGELADGSIYTAQQAMDNGLIDSIGYLDDAIAKAEQQAGLKTGTATVITLRPPFPGMLSMLLGASGGQMPDLPDAERLRTLANDLASPRLMYLMH